jgi:carboxylesterase type B
MQAWAFKATHKSKAHLSGKPAMCPTVATPRGILRGLRLDGVYAFKSIQYTTRPFSFNRLRMPQSAAPWSGLRNALAFKTKSDPPSAVVDDSSAVWLAIWHDEH